MLQPISWLESGTLRGLLIAGAGVVAAVLGLFGVNEALFNEKAAHIIEQISTFVTAAGIIYAAHQRATKPNPPITKSAVEKTAERIATETPPPISSHWMVGIAAIVLACLAFTGCTGTRSLYQQSHSPTQYAKAVIEHHNAIGKQVAALIADPAVTEQSKARLREGYRLTVCSQTERATKAATSECRGGPSYTLDKAIAAYAVVHDAKTAADVEAAVATLAPLIADLVNVIVGAK